MNKYLKMIACIFLLTILVSCTQPPDFTKESTVIAKKTYAPGSSVYILNREAGMYSINDGRVKFKAPEQFAKVGDIIIFKDGVLKVKK